MESIQEKFNEQTERYRKSYEKHGYSEYSMFMPSDRRNIRYFELLKNFELTAPFRLLDAGCGFGDINAYLKTLDIEDYSYIGIDVVDEFMEEGRKKYGAENIRYVRRNFITDDISDLEFDYAVSSQTFTICYGESDHNYEVIFPSIRKLFARCRRGVSFNFFTDQGQFKREGTAYHNPAKLLEFAYTLSNSVVLDNGCFPYECTITILKDTECSRNGMVFDHFMRMHRKKFEDGIFVVNPKNIP